MFSVYAENAQSSRLVVGAVASCSTPACELQVSVIRWFSGFGAGLAINQLQAQLSPTARPRTSTSQSHASVTEQYNLVPA